jgi:hypothetical protein
MFKKIHLDDEKLHRQHPTDIQLKLRRPAQRQLNKRLKLTV